MFDFLKQYVIFIYLTIQLFRMIFYSQPRGKFPGMIDLSGDDCPLKNHNQDIAMKMTKHPLGTLVETDVLVIGAGIAGLSAAMSAKPVAIVESEKTALVAALFIPDFIWLATGGMHGCFNGEAMQVLDGREVILFPDLKATEEWRQRLPMLESFCRRATCSDMLERIATGAQREAGLDIADFLLMEDSPQMILARMIERNPVLQIFIDTFGLELVDAGRVE